MGTDRDTETAELRQILSNAYSYESRDKHGKEYLQTRYVGTIQIGSRLYDLYVDTSGNAWYMVRIITDRGPMPEFEAIFGYPQKKFRKPKRW